MNSKKQKTKTGRSQWQRELEKESYWRAKIAAWRDSGQTVRSFARTNGISEPLFYSWRREIDIRDRESNIAAVSGKETSGGHSNVRVADARGRLVPLKFRETPNVGEKRNPFVPIKLVADVTDSVEPSVPSTVTEASLTTIDIALPGRSIMRITSDTDMTLLSKILAALEV